MTVYFPLYYKDFKCIAEKCRHSCCVGWEISVDNDTLEKYESLGREDILLNINGSEITLCEDGRCPFLCADGLCRIISELGESYTSQICREHPRFYHRIGDRVEGGIGLSCEEACRIVLSSDAYGEFCAFAHSPEVAEETDFDSISHRKFIYSLLRDNGMSYNKTTKLIREEYSLKTPIHTEEEWNEILGELEYLDESHRKLLAFKEGGGEHYEIYRRFLAYLVFRHVSVADCYENLRARIGFCLLLAELFEGLTVREDMTFEELCDIARIISEEIEYSEDNTSSLIFEFESAL